MNADAEPRFGDDGLVTAVVQDAATLEVLMVAHMNRAAWDATRSTGRATFFSRSRQRLWEKGETSGNTMHVHEIRLDCDADAVLLRVAPDGPACHTGERSCFFTAVEGQTEVLAPSQSVVPMRTFPEATETLMTSGDCGSVGTVMLTSPELASAVTLEAERSVAVRSPEWVCSVTFPLILGLPAWPELDPSPESDSSETFLNPDAVMSPE